jgi:SAM-dependent methyltransferase
MVSVSVDGEKPCVKAVSQDCRIENGGDFMEIEPLKLAEKPVLDPCCGGKMFCFDKDNPMVLYCDNREFSDVLCDEGSGFLAGLQPPKNAERRVFDVKPDIVADVTDLPFPDESFCHVVFDPPHLTHGGESSWIVKKYGKLPKNWAEFLSKGFSECWRVLKPYGTLVFKWSEDSLTVGAVIRAIGREPLYGQKERKKSKAHWLCFVKIPENENQNQV